MVYRTLTTGRPPRSETYSGQIVIAHSEDELSAYVRHICIRIRYPTDVGNLRTAFEKFEMPLTFARVIL